MRSALKILGVATGPVEQQQKQQQQHARGGERRRQKREEERPAVPSLASDGGAVAWFDLREWCGGSWREEAYLWDQLASVHRVLLVPGCLCGGDGHSLVIIFARGFNKEASPCRGIIHTRSPIGRW